ncbi:GT2 family glycosyltransferase [Solirubrobacter pauli]|uniref:GT2 family glycosyltransferase n=1 Tax=Solirubrobacter pauli TaxID=166793 RepID=A0A660LCR0_9ACTN|nr:glycosyltransferase family A protein [Solirubrobacter pauli]RKQ92359.1 GT2 family glycosyltransferase [Solirubrobacter pauli]
MESDPTLIVCPVRADSAEDIDPILQTLVSLQASAPETMVLVVDDRSPAPQAQLIEAAAAELNCAYVLQQDGEGHSAAVNVGLSAAVEHGMDVCLVSPGLLFETAGWLDNLRARTGTDGTPAAVTGGAVLESTRVIRQAGYFFSLFRRAWGARLRHVPEELLDVHEPLLCPVSSELQFLRRSWIEKVGHYDELLEGPHAALDYCLRIQEAGGQCVLEPTVRARAIRNVDGEPDPAAPSERRLRLKHANMSFQRWSPEVI